MSCIISREPAVAPEPRKRFAYRSYELARICVPAAVAEFIMGKRKELRECKAHDVYLELKEQRRLAPNYAESNRLQYLSDLFWVLSGETPVRVVRMGEKECVPTDYLERENSAFGFDKVQPCVELSLRVPLSRCQYGAVEQMERIVEKMRSFKTDFYFHDMKRASRALCRHTILWVVGTSHTFMEVLDADYDLSLYMAEGNERWRDAMLRTDDTWMGSVLQNSISKDNDMYLIQGGIVAKVQRKDFERIHADYVEELRSRIRERMSIAA